MGTQETSIGSMQEIIALHKIATELVHNREERGRRPRAQRKEHLIERMQPSINTKPTSNNKTNTYTKQSVKHNVPLETKLTKDERRRHN